MDLLQLLFFAGLAVFLGVRLYMTLGKPTGRSPEEHAREERERQAAREAAAPARPVSLGRQTGPAETAAMAPEPTYDGPAAEGLAAIRRIDPAFDPDEFLKGAKGAYEMIVTAFAKADLDTLRMLLSDRVYAKYAEAIAARQEKGETLITEIERLKEAAIKEASLNHNRAKLKIAFTAELASETRDSDGKPVSGDLTTLKTVSEIWSFERDVDDPNPNWRLSGVKPA